MTFFFGFCGVGGAFLICLASEEFDYYDSLDNKISLGLIFYWKRVDKSTSKVRCSLLVEMITKNQFSKLYLGSVWTPLIAEN